MNNIKINISFELDNGKKLEQNINIPLYVAFKTPKLCSDYVDRRFRIFVNDAEYMHRLRQIVLKGIESEELTKSA